MSANWDLILRSSADETDRKKQVSYVSYHIDLGNGLHQELRFSINNNYTFLTHYMFNCLTRGTILKMADDMILNRMRYIAKIYKGYERSRGKFDFFCALSFINEYLSDEILTGEFEYQNFSGNNEWAEPKEWVKKPGQLTAHECITKTREELFDDHKTPGYDWLFSNKLKSAQPCGKVESAYRARQQRIIFGKELPKPEEWDYNSWREDFLKQQGDKKPIEENKKSSKELICSFIGMISHEKYREFRIRYTSEMMNFVIEDLDSLLDQVIGMVRERENESQYKLMWATVQTAVNFNTARYLYAMFKQGPEAVERFEDENMNETVTDWSEPASLAKFFRFFNRTIHYETTIPAPVVEKIDPIILQSGIDFMNKFKENKEAAPETVGTVYSSRPLTEEELYPVETSKLQKNVADDSQQQAESSAEESPTMPEISAVSATPEDPKTEKDNAPPVEETSNKQTSDTEPKKVSEKPTLSYAKIVEKSKKKEPEAVKVDSLENGSDESKPVVFKVPEMKPKPDHNSSTKSRGQRHTQKSVATEGEERTEWKQVLPKTNDVRPNNKRKRDNRKTDQGQSNVHQKKIVISEKAVPVAQCETNGPVKAQQNNHEQKSEDKTPVIISINGFKKSDEETSTTDHKDKEIISCQSTKISEDNVSDEKEENATSHPVEGDLSQTKIDAVWDSQPMDPKEQEPSRETKTAKRKAKRAAKALILKEQEAPVEAIPPPTTIEKLVMTADDNSVVEADINVQVKKNKAKPKKKKKNRDGIKKDMSTVEADFTDDLATVFVNNALLAAQTLFKNSEQPTSSNIKYDALIDEPDDEDSDAYVPGQTVTYDYRPGARLNGNDSDSSMPSSPNQPDTELSNINNNNIRRSYRTNLALNGSGELEPIPMDPEDNGVNPEVRLTNPTMEIEERISDLTLHDLFRRLKFLADKKAPGGLRNIDYSRRSLVQKRLQRFQNIYKFRLRVAKAMLYILEMDSEPDHTGMREINIMKNLLTYIKEPVETDSDTLRGRNLDRITEKTIQPNERESDRIYRGLRYIDLRIAEIHDSEPLHAQYVAVGDRVHALMKEQELLDHLVRGMVDFRGYDEYL